MPYNLIDQIRDEFYHLEQGSISIDKYESLFHALLRYCSTYISTEFERIDDRCIDTFICQILHVFKLTFEDRLVCLCAYLVIYVQLCFNTHIWCFIVKLNQYKCKNGQGKLRRDN